MIPDFKTYLKESLWADVQSQAAGDAIKKEDELGNIAELKPIDLGDHCDVYFADNDLIIGDEYEFTLDDKNNMKFTHRWRLPEESELINAIYNDVWKNNRLHKNVTVDHEHTVYLTIKGKNTGEELTFDLDGESRLHYWCNGKNNGVEVGYVPLSQDDYVIYGTGVRNPGRIRLVKDK